MNDIVNVSSGALAGIAALKGNLKKVQAALPETQGSQYLRYLQDGSWVFGQSNEEVLPTDKVAINPLSIRTGWTVWTDRPGKGAKNENLGESMVPLGHDTPALSDLPVKKDPQDGTVCSWREQISVDVRFMSGPHKGVQVHYKTTSVGGIRAMRGLIDQLILQLDEDPDNIMPVVNLYGEHYPHKKYGRTYTPLIILVGWASITDAKPGEADPVEEVEAPVKATKRVVKQTPVEEAEVETSDGAEVVEPEEAEPAEEEPRRRRRR